MSNYLADYGNFIYLCQRNQKHTKKKIMTKEKISQSKEKKQALELFQSMRGQYIIGQALYLAISKLKEEPKERREISNMEDMKNLGEQLFAIGYAPTKLINEDDSFKELNKLKH
tara:strand:- start:333 stop:674 length:342 start_codon:yes stop_codon:yes gene_type:complete